METFEKLRMISSHEGILAGLELGGRAGLELAWHTQGPGPFLSTATHEVRTPGVRKGDSEYPHVPIESLRLTVCTRLWSCGIGCTLVRSCSRI